MKKIIIICVSVLLVAACAVGVAAYAVGRVSVEDDRVTGMSDADAAGEEIIYLDDFWSGAGQASISQVTDPSEVSLQKIYRESESLVRSGKKVVFDSNLFTDFYRYWNYPIADAVKYDSTRLYATLSRDEETDLDREAYLVFIASVTTYFSDYCYYDDYDYKHELYNRMQHHIFLFCSDFKDYGYDTIEEYRTALAKKECSPTPNTYYISATYRSIESIVESLSDDSPNIYESFKTD